MPDGQCESPSIGQAMPEGSLSLCRGRPFRGGDDDGEKNCNGIFFLLDEEKSRKFGLSAISVSGREKYIIEDLHRCVCVCVWPSHFGSKFLHVQHQCRCFLRP